MSDQQKKRARGEGRIFPRKGSKFLWLQYYVHGQQIRESAGTNSPEKAAKILRKTIGEVEAGIHRDTRALRFKDLQEGYYADYKIHARKSLRYAKDGTPRLDKVQRLNTYFAGFRVADICTEDLRKFIIIEQSRGLAAGTINRSLAALKRMFRLAVRDGRLRNLPYIPMLKEAPPRSGFFERAEYDALYAALPEYLRLPLALGYFTAAREGEILALKWDQVDLLAGTINLRAGETKNDAARVIPIVPQLMALLIGQQRQTGCPYVCWRLDQKSRPVKIMGFRKAWYSAAVRTGLGKWVPAVHRVTGEPLYEKPRGLKSKPRAKMKFVGKIYHDLRRSGVRNLVRSGVSERVAMEISGHKTREVFARYNITSQNDITDAGEKLAAFHKVGDISGTISTRPQQEHLPVI